MAVRTLSASMPETSQLPGLTEFPTRTPGGRDPFIMFNAYLLLCWGTSIATETQAAAGSAVTIGTSADVCSSTPAGLPHVCSPAIALKDIFSCREVLVVLGTRPSPATDTAPSYAMEPVQCTPSCASGTSVPSSAETGGSPPRQHWFLCTGSSWDCSQGGHSLGLPWSCPMPALLCADGPQFPRAAKRTAAAVPCSGDCSTGVTGTVLTVSAMTCVGGMSASVSFSSPHGSPAGKSLCAPHSSPRAFPMESGSHVTGRACPVWGRPEAQAPCSRPQAPEDGSPETLLPDEIGDMSCASGLNRLEAEQASGDLLLAGESLRERAQASDAERPDAEGL
mmetsp:Transcript_27468/g.65053  ORF Transcript_27468/g.65053 Transcript_27468/m.65053 type:complete len:336 (+) Transcript_27468:2915-3922(+)